MKNIAKKFTNIKFVVAAVLVLLLIIYLLICLCAYFDIMPSFLGTRFSKLKTGQNFYMGFDGYCKKVSDDYCLDVDMLRRKARLAKISPECKDQIWNSRSIHEDNIILEAHYIRGYFNEKYLVLCEEKEDDSLIYISVEFSTGATEYYKTESEVYELFGFDSKEWFEICNTNATPKHR